VISSTASLRRAFKALACACALVASGLLATCRFVLEASVQDYLEEGDQDCLEACSRALHRWVRDADAARLDFHARSGVWGRERLVAKWPVAQDGLL
jgi:hypothetical protein